MSTTNLCSSSTAPSANQTEQKWVFSSEFYRKGRHENHWKSVHCTSCLSILITSDGSNTTLIRLMHLCWSREWWENVHLNRGIIASTRTTGLEQNLFAVSRGFEIFLCARINVFEWFYHTAPCWRKTLPTANGTSNFLFRILVKL